MLKISPVPETLLISSASGKKVDASSRKTEAAIQKISAHGRGMGKGKAHRESGLRDACADFEALFLHKLLKTMRGTIPESGLIHHGLAHDIYTDLMDEKIADTAAPSGSGTGLGERLYHDLSRAGVEDADRGSAGCNQCSTTRETA